MKHQLIVTILSLALPIMCHSQIETPFYGYNGYPPSSIIKKDSAGNYFRADTNRIVYISNSISTYKVFDNNYNIIVEGDLGGRIYVDYFKRFGKWTEYYSNGKIKCSGFYHANQPVGLWQTYYPNGQHQKSYSITYVQTDSSSNYCMTGSYQEFYDNGKLKVNGFYKAQVDTTSILQYNVYDPNKIDTVIIRQPVSKKFSTWTYYLPNGEIEKKEVFSY